MDQELCLIAEIVMNQYNINQSLKRFGKSGVRAIEKEVHQIVTMKALDPGNPKYFSRQDCRAAIAYVMFFKEKWDFTIKA